MRSQTTQPASKIAWSPTVLKGRVLPTSADVRIDLGGTTESVRCVGLAEDGFIIESQRPLPLQQLLRCILRLPESDDLELFAFAATDSVETRQEIKPMGMTGAMAERWSAMRQKIGGTVRARGTGPTRPLKTGVYVSLPSRGDWFWRLLGRLR